MSSRCWDIGRKLCRVCTNETKCIAQYRLAIPSLFDLPIVFPPLLYAQALIIYDASSLQTEILTNSSSGSILYKKIKVYIFGKNHSLSKVYNKLGTIIIQKLK